MDDDEKRLERNRERRRQRAFRRLGSYNPACRICGEADWRCLEGHHLAGKAYGNETVITCRNCHRKLSDGQKDHPLAIATLPTPLERIAHFLHGLADFCELVVVRLRAFARELIAHVRDDSVAKRRV